MSRQCNIVDLEFVIKKKNVILDISEIEYLFIVLELSAVKYFGLFILFYFVEMA